MPKGAGTDLTHQPESRSRKRYFIPAFQVLLERASPHMGYYYFQSSLCCSLAFLHLLACFLTSVLQTTLVAAQPNPVRVVAVEKAEFVVWGQLFARLETASRVVTKRANAILVHSLLRTLKSFLLTLTNRMGITVEHCREMSSRCLLQQI